MLEGTVEECVLVLSFGVFYSDRFMLCKEERVAIVFMSSFVCINVKRAVWC